MRSEFSQSQANFLLADPSSAVVEFEQTLLSNSGEDAFESAIKLLAAKLFDELETVPNSQPLFRIYDSPIATHSAVQNLYKMALARWPNLDGSGSDLGISPPHLVRSMGPLMGWRLVDSDLSCLDAVLERLVSRDAKGAMGQYFTPREVIRLCADILNPSSKDTMIDPACGSEGFPFEAVRLSLERHGNAPKCLGIDFGVRSVKVATILTAAMGHGHISVSKANSIDGHEYANFTPTEWVPFIEKNVGSSTTEAHSWGTWNKLGCSLLMTNPPFAGEITENYILAAYESQVGQNAKSVSREHLFLERSINMLKPGGRMVIVLPHGVLSNSSSAYLRRWLFGKCKIIGVVGLHPYAFLPYTGVQTSLLFLEKFKNTTEVYVPYKIFFAVSKAPGKDSSGRITGNNDFAGIAAAFSNHLNKERVPWAYPAQGMVKPCEWEAIASDEVISADRLDAQFFDPSTRQLQTAMLQNSKGSIGHYVTSSVRRFKKKSIPEIAYVDIGSVDKKTGMIFPSSLASEEAPSRASYLLLPGDVLVSTVRPDKNVVGIVSGSSPLPLVGSNGFCVLRPENVPPEILFAYCKTEAFKTMLTRHATSSMYPTVNDKDVLSIPFIPADKKIHNKVIELIQSSMKMVQEANDRMQEAIAIMNENISIS